MTSQIIVGTEECPTQRIVSTITSSQSFHLLFEKWPSVARDLEVNEMDIKKLRKNILLEKDELADIVNEIISVWVGKEGSGATLDKLYSALGSNGLSSIADLLKNEFTLFPQSSEWDVPSYYISRTVITRNILDKAKLMEELLSSKDIFIFTGATLSQLNNIVANKMVNNSTRIVQEASIDQCLILLDYPTHFNKICTKAKCPVHLIKSDKNCDKWTHVNSSDNLSTMRNMIDKSQTGITETELINSVQADVNPVCISDSPGMGKSTLLQSLGQQLSKNNKRIVLFTSMNEFVTSFIYNDEYDERAPALELTLKKLFCRNAGQSSSISTTLNSKNLEIELLLDGLDEVTSSNMSFALELLKYLSTVPSIRVWVTTRPHLLHQLEDCLNIFGYHIQAFTKQNQASFLKNFWLSHNTNLVENRLEQFAEICLSELQAKMSRNDEHIAGIPLQCLLIGEVYMEQAEEHSVAINPNETWIIQINSLVELYQRLTEKQYNKYKLTFSDNFLTEEQMHLHHIRLAVQLIFPKLLKKLSALVRQDINLNELLKIGLLEKSSTVLLPKFVHRTIGEFYIAKFLIQLLNERTDSETSKRLKHFLNKVLMCLDTEVSLNMDNWTSLSNFNINCFVSNEICHFFDTLLAEQDKVVCVDIQLNFEMLIQACIYGDHINLFKTIISHMNPNGKSSKERIFNQRLLLLAIKYSSPPFLKIILENNATLLDGNITKVESLLLSIRNGRLPQLQYFLKGNNMHELVSKPKQKTKLVIHACVQDSVTDSSFTVKQKIDILRILLDINSDLLEQLDRRKKTSILCINIHPELLRELIKRQSNILAKDDEENTILHVHYPHLDILFEYLPTEKLKCLVKLKNKDGETPFMTLIQKQDPTIETLHKFKEFGADFNFKDNEGYSVLARSILKFRSTETIAKLIELGANVYWETGWKRKSLLHIAGECENSDAMRLLVNQFKMDINRKDWSFRSPVDYYLDKYYVKDGYNLSNQKLNILINMTKDLNIKLSPLIKVEMFKRSVELMNDSAVEYFLKDGTGSTEIYWSCDIVHELIMNFEYGPGSKILKRLINSGIIKEYNNSLIVYANLFSKYFLLHEAVKMGRIEIITCLIEEEKQNVNATDFHGRTSLQALMKGSTFNLEIANYLVSKGANTTVRDIFGNSLLHVAAFLNNIKAMEWFLSLGLDVNATNAAGESPLLFTRHLLGFVFDNWQQSGEVEKFKSKVILLCDHGANVLQVDKRGWNVLHHMAGICRYDMHEEVINYFLENGVDINAVDNEGNTPLHIVAYTCNEHNYERRLNIADQTVQIFLEKGADKSLRNKYGKTPYQIYNLEILEL